MTTYFFDVKGCQEKYIADHLYDLQPRVIYEPLSVKNAPSYQDAQIIVISPATYVTRELLNALPNLKYIITPTVAVDHVDLAATKEKNILVSNVPQYGVNTVAEFAFGLILALSRSIVQANEQAKHYDFRSGGLIGFDLRGKVLGVVGVGNVGQHVVTIGNGFAMKVIAFDKRVDEQLAKRLNFTYVSSFEELLKQADIITLHVPYNKATHHMLNEDTMKHIKRGALLINTADGKLVDTPALLRALDAKIIEGAGLDVFEGEKFMKSPALIAEITDLEEIKLALINYHLIRHPHVIVTPHIAFNTQEDCQRTLGVTETDIRNFLNNKPSNVVS